MRRGLREVGVWRLRRRGAIGCRRGDSEGDAEVKVLRLLTTPLSLPVTKKGPIAKPSSFTLKKGLSRIARRTVPSPKLGDVAHGYEFGCVRARKLRMD